MNEIHRYQVVKMLSDQGNKIAYDPHGPWIVMASDFDRVTAELEAALGREAALIEKIATIRAEHDDRIKFRNMRCDELQQRLTATDERADVLEGLLREVQKSARKQDWASGYPTLFASVDAALKPAEGGGDEYRKSCEAAHKALSMQNQRITPVENKTDPRLIDAMREAGYLRND